MYIYMNIYIYKIMTEGQNIDHINKYKWIHEIILRMY